MIRPICAALSLGLVVPCVSLIAASALAQIPGALPGAVVPGRDRPPIAEPTQPNFDFSIEGPRRSPVPRAVDEIQFHLNGIQITGAVTLPAERFRPLYQNLIGKDVSLSQILDVADSIEAQYRSAGYLLVRAFVPPQRVADGNFTINIVEGYVANVTVEGADPGTQERIRGYLQQVQQSRPLQLTPMEQGLLLANDLPGVAATGILRPSPGTPGASDLAVSVTQDKVAGGLAVDNRGSHFSGIWTMTGDVAFNSLFDDSDQLTASVTTTPSSLPDERIAGQARYRHAVGDRGAFLSLGGTITHGQPGSTLSAFNVLTNSWAVGPRFTYPFKRTRAESLLLDAGFTAQDARIKILGSQLSHDEWRVLDVGLSYLRNGFLGASWTANIDLAQGLPIFGATENGSPNLSRPGARTDFTKLTGGVRVTRQIEGPVSFALAAQGQVASSTLVNGELFTFGGTQIGRGYDPGALTGDNGFGGSAELRYDRRFPAMSSVQAMEPYVFFDAGLVRNVHNAGATDQNIESIGAGLRFWLVHNIIGAFEVAHTLEAVPGSDGNRETTKLLMDLAIRF